LITNCATGCGTDHSRSNSSPCDCMGTLRPGGGRETFYTSHITSQTYCVINTTKQDFFY